MNEANNFALVPTPPGALEKAVPGANLRRLLSLHFGLELDATQIKP
jgi:hypothetical protein